MLYAFRTQDSEAIDELSNERAMSGNAMLTIVASTNATETPSDAMPRTVRGDGARRRNGSRSGAGCGACIGTAAGGAADVVAIDLDLPWDWGLRQSPPSEPALTTCQSLRDVSTTLCRSEAAVAAIVTR
jgi:hypothetical protein